tara:strand:- start:259 stop:582 length:324 start_codon:yes stop_codon:yes gene_type:complete
MAEYEKFVKSTFRYDFGAFTLLYLSNGLGGEVGEVQNEVKKIYRSTQSRFAPLRGDQKNLVVKLDRKKALKEELGDVLWYVAAICNELDTDLNEILELNKQKLHRRA